MIDEGSDFDVGHDGPDIDAELEKLLGQQLFDRLELDTLRGLRENWKELSFGVRFEKEPDREGEARRVLAGLIPLNIDVRLWANLAQGRNVDLPVTDNYGPAAARLAPSGRLANLPPNSKGNDFGRVHSKGTQEPSAWLNRQGAAAKAKLKRIAELEVQIADERDGFASLQHGLKSYGSTLFMTALRKVLAPIFAMGPAWTVLDSIAGPSNDQLVPEDQERQTKLILLTLHGLRDEIDFRKEIKSAILAVCRRYESTLRKRGKDIWDLPYDPNVVLDNLGFPDAV